MGGQWVWVTPEWPTGDTLPWVLESSGNVVSLTFVVAHGFLCHQLDAACSHHIMELVQEQEPAGAEGRAAEGWEGGAATEVSGVRLMGGRGQKTG